MGWKKIKKLETQYHSGHSDPQTSAKIHKVPKFMKTYEKYMKSVLLKSFRRNANGQRANPCLLPRAPRALHQSLEDTKARDHITLSKMDAK